MVLLCCGEAHLHNDTLWPTVKRWLEWTPVKNHQGAAFLSVRTVCEMAVDTAGLWENNYSFQVRFRPSDQRLPSRLGVA